VVREDKTVKRRKGFTLVEIIVTVGLLTTLLACAIPFYRSSVAAWTCQRAARALYADLLLQQQRSLSLYSPAGITIHARGSYELWETSSTSADRKTTKTASPAGTLPMMISMGGSMKDLTVSFSPERSMESGKSTAACSTPGTLTITCGAEISVITITARGDIAIQ
jgi:prepilin-type N-terminal cleavage/methylation domain-containing protein